MSSFRGTPSPKDNPDGTPDYEIKLRPALTFGVELEFGIATLPRGYLDPNPKDKRQVYGLLEDRPGFELGCVANRGFHEPFANEDDVEHAASVQSHISDTLRNQGLFCNNELDVFTTQDQKASTWLVKGDSSIKFPPLNYVFQDIEVNSPPFHFCQEALNEVKVVCETLPTQYRLVSNTSCSTHVHVGNGTEGYTMSHLRNLMAMLWAFEPQLDTLHPNHRVGPTRYNGSLRKHSKLARQLEASGWDARAGMRRILEADVVNELIDLLTIPIGEMFMPFQMSTSIINLTEQGTPNCYSNFVETEKTKKTVEFRHHEGTFDAEAIKQWIGLCVRLVEFAEEVRPERMRDWLETYIDADYNVIQILEATKQPYAACYYEKKLAERAARRPDTSERIIKTFDFAHLEESMVDDYIRHLADSEYLDRERSDFG